ncbi:MAG: FHA domain-containing protein [Deltaproteobacteria bacterium]|nr:FHA domain-containing protein [Deltaproteobacteria bacterium]
MAGRPRQISISDPLWEVYESLAEESGSDLDVLVAQAMFEMALRLGFINPVPADVAPPAGDKELPAPPQARPRPPPPSKPQQKFGPGRTRETGGRPTAPPAPSAPSAPPGPAGAPGPVKRPPRPAPRPPKDNKKGLFIVNEDGDAEKIDKDIYIIGRSSKCDLVINSVKVSREHAIITRERGEFFIEDLGSANGTWYKGERIEKMKIRDGDEIFICDEKFKFVLR